MKNPPILSKFPRSFVRTWTGMGYSHGIMGYKYMKYMVYGIFHIMGYPKWYMVYGI